MAFDPQCEDYQRLALRFALSFKTADDATATRAFSSFGHRFSQDRDSLPQTDSDRAFHLVAMATQLIDYELPFAEEEEANKIIEDGHRILDEAIALDPYCYDALRMKAAASNPSFESFLDFLNGHAGDVRAHCETLLSQVDLSEPNERVILASNIAMRPYVRWVATQAEQALICGRNHECLEHAHHILEVDPTDGADVRFTAAYAYAKLEDEDGLETFVRQTQSLRRSRPNGDAWTMIARLALAFKRYDLPKAREWLQAILKSYPMAADALIRQNELPDGIFSRLAVTPYSEDEMVLALSEGAVLLQEGYEPHNRGTLGGWIGQEIAERYPEALMALVRERGL
ncbi:MAG: response regulator receiver protein [Coriobacteriales bacterium]|nr:response regulator receiver protein [Coriobacteriales bacterium]